jgi:hypothetical protein
MTSTDVLGGLAGGQAYKSPCAVATTADMTGALIGLPVIDGYQVQSGDRVLVWQNANQTTNGVYNASLSAWTLAADWSTSSSIVQGTQVLVVNGDAYAGIIFEVTSPGPITIGSTAVVFAQSGGSSALTTAGYQGALAADPALDRAGNALTSNAWYFNTVLARIKVYTSGAWTVANATILSTSGAPANSVGANGDFAMDPTLGNLYQKQAGAWVLTLSIGARGASNAMLAVVQAASVAAAYALLGGAVPRPSLRLTLTSGLPVLSAPVIAAATIYVTPDGSGQAPYWNGTAWALAAFAEVSALLSDSVNSPLAAASASVYDGFLWQKAGVWTISRGPAWTNATTRSAGTVLTRVGGLLVNSVNIANGPLAGYGLYIGTIATDTASATVTFNPTPAAASGGPTNGAWVGLWNYYNRVPLGAAEQDNKATWSGTGSGTWAASDASNNNRITYVAGQAEDSINASFVDNLTGSGVSQRGITGIGVDSTSVPSGVAGVQGGYSGNGVVGSPVGSYNGIPGVGQHFFQAIEYTTSLSITWSGLYATGVQAHQLSAQLRY